MLLEYLPGKSLIHHLDIRTKIGFFIGLIMISFLFTSPIVNLLMLAVVFCIALFVRLPLKRISPQLLGLLPIGLMIILFTSFTYLPGGFHLKENKTILIQLIPNSLGISIDGLKMGFTFVLRLLTMVLASTILTITTPIKDFEGLAASLKVPHAITFVITTALGFIPMLNTKRELIIQAQQARGANLYKKGLIKRITGYLPIFIPMITNSIEIANTLAMSMLNRGYGSSKQINYSRELSFKSADYIAFLVLFLLLTATYYFRFVLKYGII